MTKKSTKNHPNRLRETLLQLLLAEPHQRPVRYSIREALSRYSERWVTIGATDGEGGTPVKLDGQGNITAGPAALAGKSIDQLDQGVAGTKKDKRKKAKPPQRTPKKAATSKEERPKPDADPMPLAPPRHLTHRGEPTEFGRRMWQVIGKHGPRAQQSTAVAVQSAREIGNAVMTEAEKRIPKSLTKSKADQDKVADELAQDVQTLRATRSEGLEAFEAKKKKIDQLNRLLVDAWTEQSRLKEAIRHHHIKAIRESLGEIRTFGGHLSVRGEGSEEDARRLEGYVRDGADFLPRDWVQSIGDQFYSLEVTSAERGYFSGLRQQIGMSADPFSTRPSVALATHELVHAAEEAMPILDVIAQEYRDSRVRNSTRPGGDELTRIYPEATDEKMRNEVGYRDDFPAHYCGKVYPNGDHSEILSMGIEGVLHGLHGIDQDPDYTRFILGILASV